MDIQKNPLGFKVLMVYVGLDENYASARRIRALKRDLEEREIQVELSECFNDARAVIASDPTVECVLLNLDDDPDHKYRHTLD